LGWGEPEISKRPPKGGPELVGQGVCPYHWSREMADAQVVGAMRAQQFNEWRERSLVVCGPTVCNE